MAKILVTGGAGFIGAHLSRRLLALGHTVIGLDDFNSLVYPAWLKRARCQELLQGVEIVNGSIVDSDFLHTLFQRHHFSHVFHGAAHASPTIVGKQEATYTTVNVLGTLRLLQCATAYDVQRFVLVSSAAVYSDHEVPFRENHYPLRPLSVYGASKAAAEVYGQLWHERHQLSVIMLRLFSAYGPWGRPDMAPMIFTHRLLTRQPIIMNREERWRDFTYISDIVDGAVSALTTTVPFGVFNIGRGQPEQLPTLLATLEKITGIDAVIEERQAPAGEMERTYASIAQARQQLDYKPHVSLENGMRSLVQWMHDWYIPAYQQQKPELIHQPFNIKQ